ncbi:glycosyltransferase family 4 protein [Flavobacterium branchiicola]|uniref:Glycosyltransferase family 4 protein n=1 Tax=Flavobacterium branchiicola TaxID=1114875 RepID=A0ABV9PCE2_9FLAO|nr:glycosyltransferase family 4 protein [Flavobacterium branchiicola]MBS7254392.1 glycosyltransferase family 4 protein [Flavobacterium branchiicola]
MTLLIYCDEYPPARSGGIGSVTKIVAEDLVNKGHNVIVVGSYEYGNKLPYFSVDHGVKIYRLTHFKFLRFFPSLMHRLVKAVFRKTFILSQIAKFDFIKTEGIIEKIIKNEKIECFELPDYIHLLSEIKGIVRFKNFKVPTTLRIHGSVSFLGINRGTIKKNQLKNDIAHFGRTQNQTAVSDFSKQFVIDHLNQVEKLITVVHNPVEFKLIKEKPDFIRRSKTILFYGKIIKTKGAFQVINAFNVIGNLYLDWELLLIGGGEIEKAKSLLQPSLQNRVKFTGYLDRGQVVKAIDDSAFCLIPSQFENFSMAPLEVMARGKALIYTSATSGPEIIRTGYNGILVDPYNLEEIVENTKKLIENESYTEELALNGYSAVANNFTTEIISKKLISHYTSLKNTKIN